MKNKLFPLIIGGGLLILTVVYSAFQNDLTAISLSNRFFLVSLPFLIIGILLWIFSSGFFDYFQHSMKQALNRKQKKKSEGLALSEVGQGRYFFWLIIAAILIVASIVCVILAMI
ncbi:DUF3899 domain-containing protein [Enterococcus viikkiensis]|uniref:DUF3899 domain-containing protein n=1 Tax=Enterococcus viikkiensis TaxID=930854 RepID=UPI0010F4D6A6|nr:DUF3899 domain-containing protein [Enterococcus viikkiensis]